MNDMYYNDYFNSGYSYDPYQVNNGRNLEGRYDYRSSSSSSLSSSSSSYSSRVDSFFNPNEGFAKGNMQANIYQPYKLTNPGLPQAQNERERALLEVQKYGFAMWDLNLYLNTHPTDRNVMMLFEQYKTAYNKAQEDYVSKYGPLSVAQANIASGYWSWNRSPWPWEVQ